MVRDLAKDGIVPSITVEPVVMVTIKRPQPPMRHYRDDGTVSAFLEWCMANKVFPLRGTGVSGPGIHVGVYSNEDADRITEWVAGWMLQDKGGKVTDD